MRPAARHRGPTMEIVSTAVYVGPNVYAKQPLIRLTVDLHRRADMPVSEVADRVLPTLLEPPARTRRGAGPKPARR